MFLFLCAGGKGGGGVRVDVGKGGGGACGCEVYVCVGVCVWASVGVCILRDCAYSLSLERLKLNFFLEKDSKPNRKQIQVDISQTKNKSIKKSKKMSNLSNKRRH